MTAPRPARCIWLTDHDELMVREALKLFHTHYSLDRDLAAWIASLSERLHAAPADALETAFFAVAGGQEPQDMERVMARDVLKALGHPTPEPTE